MINRGCWPHVSEEGGCAGFNWRRGGDYRRKWSSAVCRVAEVAYSATSLRMKAFCSRCLQWRNFLRPYAGLCWSIMRFNCSVGTTPDWRQRTLPLLNNINVGTLCTLYTSAACGFLSMSILMMWTRSPTFDLRSSSIGAIILQGPHHSAEKSTKVGESLLTKSAKDDLAMIKVNCCW